jgi:hypothetical protein
LTGADVIVVEPDGTVTPLPAAHTSCAKRSPSSAIR